MSFALKELNPDEMDKVIATPFDALYEGFVTQFDRVSTVRAGISALDTGSDLLGVNIRRFPSSIDKPETEQNDVATERSVEIGRFVAVGETSIHSPNLYANIMTLAAIGVRAAAASPED